jgi:hypothetical protein
MTARRVASVLFLALAAIVAPPAPAQDAAAAYFSVDSVGWVQRLAAGADGSLFAAGTTVEPALPGAIEPPPEGFVRYAFVSAWARDGTVRWTRYLPFRPGEGWPAMRAVGASADGSVWVAWCVSSDADWARDDIGVAHVGADGALLVAERIGGSGIDRPSGLVVTGDGDAILAGTTSSPNFPTTDGSTLNGGETAAFVARVRADGSGVAWSRTLDVSGNVRGTALSSDGSGGVLAAFTVSSYRLDNYYDDDLATFTNLLDLGVVRLSADGAVVATTPIPHADAGAVLSLAAGADGSILAAGRTGYGAFPTDAFVMRVCPETGAATALWKERSSYSARIAVEPSGEMLVGTNLFFVDPRYSYSYAGDGANSSRLRRLSADLRDTATLFDRDGLRSIDDFAVAPDGALCVIGHGCGASFGPVASRMTLTSSFVARIPSDGVLPPSAVRIESATARGVRLSWQGGDAPASYVIERSADPMTHWDAGYDAVREVGGGVHEAHVGVRGDGLPCWIRVVAEFASGVRMASAAVEVLEPPSRLTARWTPHGVRVEWRRAWLTSDLRYELERRVGGGPWQNLSRSRPNDLSPGDHEFLDQVPPLSGTRVRYRLRVVPTDVEGRSPWTYSNDVSSPAPSLRVRQVTGSVHAAVPASSSASVDDAPVRFEVDGTFVPEPVTPAPPFDPMSDDLRVWVGALHTSRAFVARAGDPQWTRDFSRWTWEHVELDGTLWRITIDPAAGTFSVRGRVADAGSVGRGGDSVILGLSYGEWSGGEIRRWTRLPGPQPNLVQR